MAHRPKIAIVGTGPAGLAAAELLLDRAGDSVEVELLTLGHHLGGKACSWTLPDGRVVEHGQHLVTGFYRELRALLRRSGFSLAGTLAASDGEYLVYEERDGGTHHLYAGDFLPRLAADWFAYEGFTPREKAGITDFVLRFMAETITPVSESLDDLCFSAWVLSRGFPVSAARTHVFRAIREVQLNWPDEISAFAMLQSLRMVSRSPARLLTGYPTGGMSESWWDPIGARIEALGGTIRRRRKLVGLARSGGALTGLTFAAPRRHAPGERYEGSVPTVPGSEVHLACDAAILAMPAPALHEVLPPDLLALPALSGVPKIEAAAPLCMQVWHRARPASKRGRIVAGLELPLGFAMDNKPNYDVYRDDDRYGAVLHFVGQMAGFEEMTDEELLDRGLRSLRRVEGYEAMDREGVIDFVVLRHSGPHAVYWNAVPGSLRHKPRPRTPVPGLWLAGDWIRSELAFPSMETAIRSGRHAARLVLEDLVGQRALRRDILAPCGLTRAS